MRKKTRIIKDLPWTHFLKRLWWFKLPTENDSQFVQRAGITKHNKSKWLNAVQPTPSIDTIEKLANNLKLTPEEKHWLTFGSAPLVPVPPSLSPWRAPTPTQFTTEFVKVAEKLYEKQENATPEQMRATLMETFRVAREHTRLAWESLGTYSEPDSPILYSPVTTAVASLIREIEMLRQTTNRHERKNLLQWLSETFGEIRRELLTGERHQTSQVTGAVIPFPGARPVTLREGDVDSSRYFYIPKAEPRLAAGAGTFVTSETSDDYYAFRLDWLNHLVSKKGDLWLFDVVGDSMSNTLEHGDIVLIDCGRQEPLHGKIYAIEEDNAVSIKRVQKRKDGTFWIVSDNKATRGAYKPLYPPKRLGPHIRIIGRMIWSARTWL